MTDNLLKIESIDDTYLLTWALEALARTCSDLCAAQAHPTDKAPASDDLDRMLALLVLSVSLLSHLRASLDRLATASIDPDEAEPAVTRLAPGRSRARGAGTPSHPD